MVMLNHDAHTKSTTEARSETWAEYGRGGPVFLPPRQLSPLARTLLSKPFAGERVTAYDDLWYLGRPQES